jgi:hypothetical protein
VPAWKNPQLKKIEIKEPNYSTVDKGVGKQREVIKPVKGIFVIKRCFDFIKADNSILGN